MKITPSLVISSIALIVALGGTTYAITALPANSVGPKQIRADAVTGKKIAKGAVGSEQIADGSVRATDLAPGVIFQGGVGAQGPAGPAGPAGPIGPSGAAGSQGAVGPTAGFVRASAFNPTPAVNPLGLAVATQTITTTTAGRLWVSLRGVVGSPDCSGVVPNVRPTLALYVDDTAVPGSAIVMYPWWTTTEPASFQTNGITTGVVQPGAHTVTAVLNCATTTGEVVSGNTAVGVLVLGS